MVFVRLVKVAYGGALYSMSQYVKTEEDAVQFCKALKVRSW